jgi:small subunit ribosomal protein S8e
VRVRPIRVRGGNYKYRALRLKDGNFSWSSENITFKTKILDVVYNASNNELIRTKTLVKNCVVLVDATPFKKWFETHYGVAIGKKKADKKGEKKEEVVKKSNSLKRKLAERLGAKTNDPRFDGQFDQGRLYACVSSRPGQSGRADGYLLEGKEL